MIISHKYNAEWKETKIKLMIINEEDWLKNKNLVLEKIIEFIREG